MILAGCVSGLYVYDGYVNYVNTFGFVEMDHCDDLQYMFVGVHAMMFLSLR